MYTHDDVGQVNDGAANASPQIIHGEQELGCRPLSRVEGVDGPTKTTEGNATTLTKREVPSTVNELF